MLYVSTRNKMDAYTAAHAWNRDRCADGGLYVPFRLPEITPEQLAALGEVSFGQTVAKMLGQFFACRLQGWDVDFAIGRSPVKVLTMSHRLLIAENWHNLDQDFAPMVQRLTNLVLGSDSDTEITDWAHIAIRIAVLFGIFGELRRCGMTDLTETVDIAVPTGNFDWPMAAWYSRKMGLPIGMIICACNDNGAGWDLLHQGNLHTDAVALKTNTPLCDYNIPSGLERLIHATLGNAEAKRFSEKLASGSIYALDEEQLSALRQGMYSAVISSSRVSANILSLSRAGGYYASPYTALSYSGLMDYRARTGESRKTLLLGDHSPEKDLDTVAAALDISASELQKQLR